MKLYYEHFQRPFNVYLSVEVEYKKETNREAHEGQSLNIVEDFNNIDYSTRGYTTQKQNITNIRKIKSFRQVN